MIEGIIKRIVGSIKILSFTKDLLAIIESLSVEFYRLISLNDEIKNSVVPNIKMSVNSISDYNRMFGIPNSLTGTDADKIKRIIEKSDALGFPGKDWLEAQVQNAGFNLYVIQQKILDVNINQWGESQFGDFQFGISQRFEDPSIIPGVLIVNQPYGGLGKIFISQYGPAILDVYGAMYGDIQYGLGQYGTIDNQYIYQYGTEGFQYGTPDLDYTYPRAQEYKINQNAPGRFGFFFFLSPFPDRLAIEGEMLTLSVDDYNYLRKLVISSKLVRDYCIAQVEVL